MAKTPFNTSLDTELLTQARELAKILGFKSATGIIEEALRLYFANYQAEVWEKPLPDGTLQKLTVRPDKVLLESIRTRKVATKFDRQYVTEEALEARGWARVWKMRRIPAPLRVVASQG